MPEPTKIFVGGLNYGTTSDGLRVAAERFGEVVWARVQTYPNTSQSRGFGFILAASAIEAQQIIDGLDCSILDDRPISARPATPKGQRSS